MISSTCCTRRWHINSHDLIQASLLIVVMRFGIGSPTNKSTDRARVDDPCGSKPVAETRLALPDRPSHGGRVWVRTMSCERAKVSGTASAPAGPYPAESLPRSDARYKCSRSFWNGRALRQAQSILDLAYQNSIEPRSTFGFSTHDLLESS